MFEWLIPGGGHVVMAAAYFSKTIKNNLLCL